jgi:hypothetical protein
LGVKRLNGNLTINAPTKNKNPETLDFVGFPGFLVVWVKGFEPSAS